jgi:hypothetical protein
MAPTCIDFRERFGRWFSFAGARGGQAATAANGAAGGGGLLTVQGRESARW